PCTTGSGGPGGESSISTTAHLYPSGSGFEQPSGGSGLVDSSQLTNTMIYNYNNTTGRLPTGSGGSYNTTTSGRASSLDASGNGNNNILGAGPFLPPAAGSCGPLLGSGLPGNMNGGVGPQSCSNGNGPPDLNTSSMLGSLSLLNAYRNSLG
ncbi:unnamed protein product, partial [Amoebophrya sp. A25]